MTAFTDDALLQLVGEQTDLLLDQAQGLDEPAVRAPSLLPRWSRGHVLAHLARNADGIANLARTATTGVECLMYPSRAERDAEIDRDAGRSPAAHRRDLRESAARLARALAEVPATTLDDHVPTGLGSTVRVGDLVWIQLRELAYHRVDLAAGTTFEHQPEAVLRRGLLECQGRLDVRLSARCRMPDGSDLNITLGDGATAVSGTAVSGTAGSVLGWLTGRTAGAGVDAGGGGPLPAVPVWG